MSDLQKSFAKAQLSRLPPEPSLILDEREEEDEVEDELDGTRRTSADDSSSASSTSSTGTIVPSSSRNLFERPKGTGGASRYAPLPWNEFFSQELYFVNQNNTNIVHHAYLTPPSTSGPLIVTHHGAGSSGLSFAAFFAELRKAIPTAGILSIDARGHGSTASRSASQPDIDASSHPTHDLSLETLATDLAFVVEQTRLKLQWPKTPDVILLGHSLGGAVVTEVAHQRLLGTALLGYGVLDVVEGSAIDALQSMEQYLQTRPKTFPSIASGIEWHTRSRTTRNTTSARVSVPSLLTRWEEPEEQEDKKPDSSSASTDANSTTGGGSKPTGQYHWITDLASTKPYWESWFTGLSRKFLSSPGGKLLILAGTDRLDKELMIGQMQGKYQLQVFPEAGHFVHEDQPSKTASVLADFWRRNDRGALVLPPKVGDLIRQGKVKGKA